MDRTAWTLLGGVDPRRKLRDLLRLTIPWLLADLVTKLLALWLLSEKTFRFLGGAVQLQLVINERLFGSMQEPAKMGITPAMIFGGAVLQGLLAAAGLAVGRAEWTTGRRLLLLGFAVFVGAAAGMALGSLLPRPPDRLAVHTARAFGSVMIMLLGLRLTRSRYLGLALSLWIAGNLGNAINVLYHPRGVIDFLYIPVFRSHITVFNLADVALELAMGLLLISPVVLIFLRRLARRSPAWERRLLYTNPPEPPRPETPSTDTERSV